MSLFFFLFLFYTRFCEKSTPMKDEAWRCKCYLMAVFFLLLRSRLFLFVDTSIGCLIVSLYVYLFSFVLNFFKCG